MSKEQPRSYSKSNDSFIGHRCRPSPRFTPDNISVLAISQVDDEAELSKAGDFSYKS